MPLYEFVCNRSKCEKPFELMRPASQCSAPAKCPACGSKATRLFSIPHLDTETNAYTEERSEGRQFKSKAMQDYYRKKAVKAGVNLAGKVYNHQLADFPGDPAAWVGSDAHIKEVCKARGHGAKGKGINHGARESDKERAPVGGLSEKVVARHVMERMYVDPGQKVSKVVEDVMNDHAPRNAQRIVPCRKKGRRKQGK